MSQKLERSVFQILTSEGRIAGAGFIVNDRLAVTCAHVIEELGGSSGSEVLIEFFSATQRQIVRVSPEGWSSVDKDDVAFLDIDRLPDSVQSVRLGSAKESQGNQFLALGFPGWAGYPARWANGQIQGIIPAGNSLRRPLLQIEGNDIRQGMSGSPVYDVKLERVIGMVNEYADDALGRFAWAVTADTLVALHSNLKLDIDLLNAYRTQILSERHFINLAGIPLPRWRSGRRQGLRIPLDRVYIQIQAIKEDQFIMQEEAERKTLEMQASSTRGHLWSDDEKLVNVRMLGEYLYHQGELYKASERPKPVDPEEALQKYERLVILGAPGAGKSTLIQFLARMAASESNGHIPIVVSLREYASAVSQDSTLSVREFALRKSSATNPEYRNILESEIRAGRVLWLVDALDETRHLAAETARQVGQLPGRLVLTSRPIGYESVGLDNLPHFEILPLTEDNVQDFIRNWFSLLAETHRHDKVWLEQRSEWLILQFEDEPRKQVLMRNPLLLTFMVILSSDDTLPEIPTRRVELYRRYIEELFDSWEVNRRPINRSSLEPILTLGSLTGIEARRAILDGFYSLGWAMHMAYFGSGPARLPTRAELLQTLTGYLSVSRGRQAAGIAWGVLEFWEEAGMLDTWRLVGDELLAFHHLTFQEYAAAYILQGIWEQSDNQAWVFIEPRLHHFAWREPILLMCGQLDLKRLCCFVDKVLQAHSPYENLLHRDLILALDITRERPELEDSLKQAISSKLLEYTRGNYSENIKIYAIRIMGQSRSPEFINHLIKIVGEDYSLRRSALIALGRIGLPAIPSLLELSLFAWNKGDDDLLIDVSLGLSLTGDPQVILELFTNCQYNEYSSGPIRNHLMRTGKKLGKKALPKLFSLLGSDDSSLIQIIAELFGEIGDPSCIPVLQDLLKNSNSVVRSSAACSLGRFGNAQSIPDLTIALQDTVEFVREDAAQALGEINDSRGLSALMEVIDDKQPRMRSAVAEAIGKIRDPKAYTALHQLVNDESPEVRKAAALALGKIGHPESSVDLINLLKDSKTDVRLAAVHGLKELPGIIGVPGLVGAMENKEWQVQLVAALALGKLKLPQAIPVLFRLIAKSLHHNEGNYYRLNHELQSEFSQDGENIDLDFIIGRTLGNIGGAEVREGLLKLLLNPECCWTASLGLAFLADSEALPGVRAILAHPDSSIRRAAVGALWSMDDPQVLQDLRTALGDEDASVRKTAAKVIGVKKLHQALPDLIRALDDDGFMVQRFVLGAIENIGDPAALPDVLQQLENGVEKFDIEPALKVVRSLSEIIRDPKILRQTANTLIRYVGIEYTTRDLTYVGLIVLDMMQNIASKLAVIETQQSVIADPLIQNL